MQLPFEMIKEIFKFQTTWWLKKNMALVYIEKLWQIPRLLISDLYSYVDLKLPNKKQKYRIIYYSDECYSDESFFTSLPIVQKMVLTVFFLDC